ncbi:MAG: site-specific integrase, partial [Planctomycetes bacterium]|nr:site-specific integrase [Planctomycetota bacterium]
AAILPLLRKARHPGDGRSDSELATSVFARYRLNDGSLVSPKWDDEHAPELDGKAVKAALTEWKIGTFHDLRRTFCTRAAAVLPMHVLKHYAGHADIATTVAFYLQTDADDAAKLRAAMSAVA